MNVYIFLNNLNSSRWMVQNKANVYNDVYVKYFNPA